MMRSPIILHLLLVGLCCASEKNETLTDIPSGSPVIKTKVMGLGKVYFGNKLYLRCPLSSEEVKDNLRLAEEKEDESEEETPERSSQNQPLTDLKWFRDGVPIEASQNESKEAIMRKEWLYLQKEDTENLMGTFTCEYQGEETASFRSIVALSIIKIQTSYTVTEGEDLKLHCQVGAPFPSDFSLTWYTKKNLDDPLLPIQEVIQNTSSNAEEAHLKILSKDGVPNAVLKIEDAVYEDRAYYYCIGVTENEEVRVGTLVRIKDKYAALWPFLGIVAEVIVLCLIILICDKRAAKKEEEEDDDGLSGTGAGNAGGDSSGLRQRK